MGANHVEIIFLADQEGNICSKWKNMWFTYMATWHEGLSLTWVQDDSIDSKASRNLSGSFAFHQHVEKYIKWGWTHRSWKLKGLKDDLPCRDATGFSKWLVYIFWRLIDSWRTWLQKGPNLQRFFSSCNHSAERIRFFWFTERFCQEFAGVYVGCLLFFFANLEVTVLVWNATIVSPMAHVKIQASH